MEAAFLTRDKRDCSTSLSQLQHPTFTLTKSSHTSYISLKSALFETALVTRLGYLHDQGSHQNP
jgi:hypothetical protein